MQISRKAFKNLKEFLSILYDKYAKLKNQKNGICPLEQHREDFSSWVKNNEYIITLELKNYLKNKIVFYDSSKKEYFKKLYEELFLLYFKCELCIPPIQIDFSNNELIYNCETMIDFINKGPNRQVNFVFFPSLFTNGKYLDNGKKWVFTYTKNTFRFNQQQLVFE